MDSKQKTNYILAALLTVQILFGINYVVSKVVVSHFPPICWASLRASIAAIFLICIAFVSRRPHPKWSIDFFGPLIGYSLLGVVINQACFLVGLRYTTSTNAALLNTLIPLLALLIVVILKQEAATREKVTGFLAAFLGVLVLLRAEKLSFSEGTMSGDMLILINASAYALFLSLSKKFFMRYDGLWSTAWLFVFGSVGLNFIALPEWVSFRMPELTPVLIGCVAFAIIGGTMITYSLNIWALANTDTSRVALFIYLQPIVAMILAVCFLGEELTPRTLLAGALIFLAIYSALFPRKSKPLKILHSSQNPKTGKTKSYKSLRLGK